MNARDPELTPCPHVRSALFRIASGRRGGPWTWYALLHALRCPQCRRALDALKRYFATMREEPSTASRIDWTSVSNALDDVDAGRSRSV